MDLPAGLITQPWLWLSWLVYAAITLLAVVRAPWFRLRQSDSSNTYFGAIVTLLLLWSLNAGILPGVGFHFLGITAACLMFGWEFAFLAVQLLLAILIAEGRGSWETLAINALFLGAVPAGITHGLLRLTQRYLPRNYFVYIFINTFFAAITGMLVIGALIYGLMAETSYATSQLGNLYLVFFMAAIPEGTLNGMMISILVIYKPGWVTTFRDEIYLVRKPKQ